jgi:hypothetical protein
VGDDGAVAFPSPDASDEDSVMWDPWLNGSGLVVPTPGLEPGSGSETELLRLIQDLARTATHGLEIGSTKTARRLLQMLAVGHKTSTGFFPL